ncbi:hypothetical protein HK414_16165 [Ramlibacter terrae]|uniref:LEPR-XLL domain-containing protein n=1 Tax=Ramlibacter terrae TaxID=2732511 RepID=A0ABX6P5N2_9BURK|nr:hypothetical protein HK414_16165 [Ramlibacter terrae]
MGRHLHARPGRRRHGRSAATADRRHRPGGPVGINTGSDDFIGFGASDVTFALGLFTEAANDARGWQALKAVTGRVAFEGIDGLEMSADSLDVVINRATTPGDHVLDFSGNSVLVATGPDSEVEFDMDGAQGDLLQASGTIDVDIFGFFQASGGFAFGRSDASLTLSDGEVVDTQLFTPGAANVEAFIGTGGGNEDRVGLDLHGVEFGPALATTDRADPARSWTSLSATAAGIEVAGIEGLTPAASNLGVSVNSASLQGGPVVDYAAQSVVVPTGGTGITLNMDGQRGELLEARGTIEVDAFGFFRVVGSFAVTKSTEQVTLDDGTEVEVGALTIGADGVDAFVGMNHGTPDAVGIELEDVGFALALLRENLPASSPTVARQWSALQAGAGRAELVGVTGIEAKATSVQVQLNRADANGHVIDFSASPLEVATGPGLGVSLDLDGEDGAMMSAAGEFAIDVRGFFRASGSLAIERRTETLHIADLASTPGVDESGEVDVDLLTLGGTGLDAFVGVGGGTADALGVAISGVEFGPAMAGSRAARAPEQPAGFRRIGRARRHRRPHALGRQPGRGGQLRRRRRHRARLRGRSARHRHGPRSRRHAVAGPRRQRRRHAARHRPREARRVRLPAGRRRLRGRKPHPHAHAGRRHGSHRRPRDGRPRQRRCLRRCQRRHRRRAGPRPHRRQRRRRADARAGRHPLLGPRPTPPPVPPAWWASRA